MCSMRELFTNLVLKEPGAVVSHLQNPLWGLKKIQVLDPILKVQTQ